MRLTFFFLVSLVLWALFNSCNGDSSKNKRIFDYTWKKDKKLLKGDSLLQLLYQADFQKRFYPPQVEVKDTYVFTNADEVFPFMASFINENDDFIKNDYIEQSQTVIYKDPIWGDVFLYSALLNTDERLFLKSSYSARGNIMFGGPDAIYRSSYAQLIETFAVSENHLEKVGVYWARGAADTYLFIHHQEDNLIRQFGLPLLHKDTLKLVQKIVQINRELHINSPVLSQITKERLQKNPKPTSFFVDPYRGFYVDSDSYMLPRLLLKIKNFQAQPLSENQTGLANPVNLFTKDSVQLAFKKHKTNLTLFEFNESYEENGYTALAIRQQFGGSHTIFFKEEKQNKQIKLSVYCFLTTGAYVELIFLFEDTPKQRNIAENVIHNLRVRQI